MATRPEHVRRAEPAKAHRRARTSGIDRRTRSWLIRRKPAVRSRCLNARAQPRCWRCGADLRSGWRTYGCPGNGGGAVNSGSRPGSGPSSAGGDCSMASDRRKASHCFRPPPSPRRAPHGGCRQRRGRMRPLRAQARSPRRRRSRKGSACGIRSPRGDRSDLEYRLEAPHAA
jgi:hypothetical protein